VFSQGDRSQLRIPDGVTIDELDAWRLGYPVVGDVLEIDGKRARIAAKTEGILGFITTPYVFTSLEKARAYTRMRPGFCSYFLVQTDPGADVEDICARIRQRVPDLDAYTSEEFSFRTRLYWAVRSGLGMSFGSSTLLGLMVGLVVVAQSLFAFVLDHQGDYATLKALGAEDAQVYRILVTQSLAIAIAGAVLGNAFSVVLRRVISTPRVTIDMHVGLVLAATGLAILICLVSALLPFRRIRKVDPVTVLQE
jgi:putative ABC transport system permease protein